MERALRDHGLTVRRVDTRDLEHARELAREAARAGETVVALSGDGLVGVIADALRRIPGSLLGVLPGGRGNDLARVLGIPERRSAPARRSRPGSRGRSTSASSRRLAARIPAAPSSGSPRRASTAMPQPHRQRSALLARRARLRLRSAARADLLAPGALRDRARLRRAPRRYGLHGRGRQLAGLRRRHVRRPRGDARRRPARRRRQRTHQQAALPGEPAASLQGHPRRSSPRCACSGRPR